MIEEPDQKRRRRTWVIVGGLVAVAAAAAIVVPLTVTGGSLKGPATAAVTRGLHVVPFPGTPDAAATSSIIFSSLKASEIKSVTVTGSRSGNHAGRLTTLPAGRGTAFVPDRPFTAGEQVSVTAPLTSPAAGTASGADHASALHFAFTVAVLAGGSSAPASPSAGTTTSSAKSGNAAKASPTQSFHSQPSLRPPAVTVSKDSDSSSGDIFLTPANGSQVGPMILDPQGQLVWFYPISGGDAAFNLAVQSYQGQPVLTWWQGKVVNGHGTDGEDVILNRSYQTVAVVHAGEGYSSDLHEFQITSQGTALVTAYVPVKANLSSVGGPADGTVLDSVVQEVDIRTGQVLWEWHALGHVPLTASYSGKPSASAAYDYFHINSIQQLPNGNLLVSSRNTWAIYEISRSTGQVIWRLGGKHSSFKMGSGTNFEWQHDARLASDGTLTLFDDAATPKEEAQSRALQLTLNTATMTASLRHSYTHDPPLLAGSQGSVQILPNGNVFVGWGAEPNFSEYTASGRQIFTGSFTLPVESYRARRFSWTGKPVQPPSAVVAANGANGKATVYASWNGATDVARWQLLGGPSPGQLSVVSSTATTGFETAVATTTSRRYLAVRALDSSGRVLGTSASLTR